MEDTSEVDPLNPCMYVYNEKIQSDGSLDKLKFKILLRGYLQNKYMIGYTWSPT